MTAPHREHATTRRPFEAGRGQPDAPPFSGAERSNGPRAAAGEAAHSNGQAENPLEPLLRQFAELQRLAKYYAQIRWDEAKLEGKKLVWGAILGVVVGMAGLTAVAVSTALFLLGIAHGLSELLGHRIWAGELITAVGVLAAALGAAYVVTHRLSETSRQKTYEKYEHEHLEQRLAHGCDVLQRGRGQSHASQPAAPRAL